MNMNKKLISVVIATATAGASVTLTAAPAWAADTPPAAESAAPAPDAWQFEVTPYLLAAGMDGTLGVRGVTTDIDVPFDELVDDLEGGFMGLFTARKGPWTFGFEGVYMKLGDTPSKSATGPAGQVTVNGALNVTNHMYIYQGSAGYRVLDDKTKVDLIGALRYTKLDAEAEVRISTTPPIEFLGGAVNAKGSESWTDAVVGVSAQHPVSDKVSLVGYADVGGGGSDLTYQVILGANWQFSETFAAKAGYRHMYWDYENDGVVWDMTAAGPYLGLGIRF